MHEIPDVKLLLETELDALRAYVTHETQEPYKNVAAIDLVDGAQTVEHQEFVALSTARLVRRASKVRSALERLREGSYGLCEGCCNPIPAPRLAAVPTATTCLPCQSELEQRQRENPHGRRRPRPAPALPLEPTSKMASLRGHRPSRVPLVLRE
jgi:RNA polymerase-binding transcription factor DksA